MHPQLQSVVDEFDAASDRFARLVDAVPGELWPQRADPDRWSIGECVAHLNLTARAFLPPLRDALEEGRRRGEGAPVRYRRDPLGWLLWRTMGPPARLRVRTSAAFVPEGAAPASALVEEFRELQREQIACVESADGLPLQKLKIRSPFDARVGYNVFAALSILPRHQHRHLWQAEQVAQALGAGV